MLGAFELGSGQFYGLLTPFKVDTCLPVAFCGISLMLERPGENSSS